MLALAEKKLVTRSLFSPGIIRLIFGKVCFAEEGLEGSVFLPRVSIYLRGNVSGTLVHNKGTRNSSPL